MTRTTIEPPATDTRTPPVSILRSAQRHWITVLLPVVVLVALASVLALKRAPTYTATARLSVGRIDVSAPGALAGFSQATASLASSYSRAIDANGVIDPLAKASGLSPEELRRRLSATPIADSPVLEVTATGTSARASTALANAASAQLIRYVVALNRSNPDSARLLARFKRSALTAVRTAAVAQDLKKASVRHASGANDRALQAAQASAEAANLRRESLRVVYQNSLQGQSTTSLLQPLSRASDPTSDRLATAELLVFIALLAGLFVGLALATFRANRAVARSALRDPSG